MGKRVTILDVAAEAGVSRQTVTRAMNGMDDIKETTRHRVLAAAERLGYRPNRYARNLVTRQEQHALGLVVASFGNPYYTDVAASMLSVAAERGWQLLMAAEQDDLGSTLGILSTQVDAVVTHSVGTDAELREAAGGLPVVRLESASALPGVHSVELDIESGIVTMVAELRERGARRFGMVDTDPSPDGGGRYRPSLKRQWFERAAGARFAGAVVADESIAGGGRALDELLERHPDIDAVLMFNDLMALGAVQHAHARGIDVPGRVRIVGIDGLVLGAVVNPPLTSISLNSRGLAAGVLDIAQALAKADFARLDPIRRTVPSQILWRASA